MKVQSRFGNSEKNIEERGAEVWVESTLDEGVSFIIQWTKDDK